MQCTSLHFSLALSFYILELQQVPFTLLTFIDNMYSTDPDIAKLASLLLTYLN